MKGKNLLLMGLAVLTAGILWAASVWASADDPWAPDMDKNQLSPKSTIRVAPALPAEEDRGYPWFADIMEDNPTLMKPVTVFELHPRTAEEDKGYPWFDDVMENNLTILQFGAMTHCYDNFTVENLNKEMAEVSIIRGDEDNPDINQIPPGGKLGYKLQHPAGARGGDWVDEARIINSTAGDSKLKVHCNY